MAVKKKVAKKKAVKKKVAAKKRAASRKKPEHPLMVVGPKGSHSDFVWNREAVVDHLCDQLVSSSLGIGKILAAGYHEFVLPTYSTIMKWFDEEDTLSDRYARAKEAQADFMADEIIEIADDGTNDWMEQHDKEGACIGYKINGEHVQRSRLRVDSRKWLASKLKAKKYGDKVQTEHSGSIGLTTILEDIDGNQTGLPDGSPD